MQIRNTVKVENFLCQAVVEVVINAFISSQLDYCSSLYTGLNHKAVSRLQLIQNWAAKLLTNSKKTGPYFFNSRLTWNIVKYRIDLKILLITFKARHGFAPSYIKGLLTPYELSHCLLSSSKTLLYAPTARFVLKGDRAFLVCVPQFWNSCRNILGQLTEWIFKNTF